jgi:hypothetical protein
MLEFPVALGSLSRCDAHAPTFTLFYLSYTLKTHKDENVAIEYLIGFLGRSLTRISPRNPALLIEISCFSSYPSEKILA